MEGPHNEREEEQRERKGQKTGTVCILERLSLKHRALGAITRKAEVSKASRHLQPSQPWAEFSLFRARTPFAASQPGTFSQEQRVLQDLLSFRKRLCPWLLTYRKLCGELDWAELANPSQAQLPPPCLGRWPRGVGAGPALNRLQQAESQIQATPGSSGFNTFCLNQGQRCLETPSLQLHLPSQGQELADKSMSMRVQAPGCQVQARPIPEHLPNSFAERLGDSVSQRRTGRL